MTKALFKAESELSSALTLERPGDESARKSEGSDDESSVIEAVAQLISSPIIAPSVNSVSSVAYINMLVSRFVYCAIQKLIETPDEVLAMSAM